MIVLITDFGLEGPYVGQVQAVIWEQAPGQPVINLFADAPVFNPKATAYLLDAYQARFPVGTVFLCVVDPRVGTGTDAPVVVQAHDKFFVGPDNGLFDTLLLLAPNPSKFIIRWRAEGLSHTFHGRDLYAPVAARLAQGLPVDLEAVNPAPRTGWRADLYEVIYIDSYGNAVSGIRGSKMHEDRAMQCEGLRVPHAHTFGAVPRGCPFWYVNSNGLVELAVNQGRADEDLGIHIGSRIQHQQ